MDTLSSITVQAFMQSRGFVSVVRTVKENKNGYPFVTFIDAANVAENIYFSKNASALVTAGTEIARGFFTPFMVAETTNAEGEKRMKLVAQGESMRVAATDLF